jgi:signal peptidase
VRGFLKIGTTAACLLVMTVVVLLILVPALFGLQRYVITGGSMTGTIPKGAIVYSKLIPTKDLKVGDIITFRPPGYGEAVTHRIVAIEPGQDGKLVYHTKGDFNETEDPWEVNLEQPKQARYDFYVPYVGYALAALSIRQVRVIVIALPAAIIAISLIWSLWAKAGEELRREEEAELVGEDRCKA